MNETPAWVDWFQDLVDGIADDKKNKEDELSENVKKVDWKKYNLAMLKYKDDNEKFDPFSVILYLAQTFNDYGEEHKEEVREAFGIGNHGDVCIPAPPGPAEYRQDKDPENTKLLWKLFRQARQGIEAIKAKDFACIIKNINGVASGNITLGLFFTNPKDFFPITEATMPKIKKTLGEYKECSLDTLKKKIEKGEEEFDYYKSLLNKLKSAPQTSSFYEMYAECVNDKKNDSYQAQAGLNNAKTFTPSFSSPQSSQPSAGMTGVTGIQRNEGQ